MKNRGVSRICPAFVHFYGGKKRMGESQPFNTKVNGCMTGTFFKKMLIVCLLSF